MWEQSLIESGSRKPGKKWYVFPLSATIHIAVISVLVLSSYWYVEKVDGQPFREPIRVISVGTPPAYGDELAVHAKQDQQETESVPVPEMEEQLTEIVPEANTSLPEMMGPSGAENATGPVLGPGSPDGIKGGDPNSTGWPESMGTRERIDDTPIIITSEVEQPVLLERVEPLYPRNAILLGLQGYVVLQAVITKTGSVEELKILRSDHAVFNNNALEAVRKWKYRPATINGRPVKVYFTVTVHFQLR